MFRLVILLIVLFSTQFALSSENWVIDKVRRLDIKTNIPLVELDLADGIETSLRYRYLVEPSYLGNYYTRVDQMEFNLNVNPTDYIDVNEHIGMSMKRGTKLSVVRQFPSQKQALIAPPTSLLLSRLPTTAERAIDRLQVGDLVSFQTELTFSVGASYAKAHGWLTANLYAAYIVRGEFEVRVYRLPDNKVRMQIFSTGQKYKSIGGRLSLTEDIEIFGVSIVDKRIEKLVRTTFLDLGVSFGRQKLFLMDYVLKLDEPRVAKAYNDILSASTDIKHIIDFNIVHPNRNNEKILKHIASQFNELEKIAKDEHRRKVGPEKRLVRRIFKGNNINDFNGGHFRIGFNFLRFEAGSIFRDIHLSRDTEDGKKEYYGFPSFTETNESRLLFGLAGKFKGELSYNMLFRENEKQEPIEFLNLGGYFNYSDKVLDVRTQRRIRYAIREHLPLPVFNMINWGDWNQEITRKNARVYADYYFHKSAFQYLRPYSQKQLESLLRDYLDNLKTPLNVSESHRNVSGDYCATDETRERLRGIHRRDKYTGDICYISYHLYQAVQNHHDPQFARDAFLGLKGNELFRKVGIGLLSTLIPEEALIEVFRFEMHWMAKDTKPLTFKFGSKKERELYKLVISIQTLMNNRSYDMRILDDALKGRN